MELGQLLDLDLLELNLFEPLLIPPLLDHLLVLVMDRPLEQPALPCKERREQMKMKRIREFLRVR